MTTPTAPTSTTGPVRAGDREAQPERDARAPAPPDVGWPPRRSALWLVAATVLGFGVRWLTVGGPGHPVGDGGLFFVAVEGIVEAGFALPETIPYNGTDIPFAYPPLAFYLAALAARLPGVGVLDALTVIPPVASSLTVPAVYLLARRLLRDEFAAVLAAFVMALLPMSILLVEGGSLTRAPGLLFAVLGLVFLHDALRSGGARPMFATTLALGGAVLTHPEAAWFAVFSSALFLAAVPRGQRREAARRGAVVAGGVAALAAPWVLVVLARHGVEPFMAAGTTGAWSPFALIPLATFRFTEEPFLDVFAVLALIGLFKSISSRDLLLPAWLLAIFLLDPRKGPVLAAPVAAMLAARALGEVVAPALEARRPGRARFGAPALAFFAAILALGLLGAVTTSAVQGTVQPSWLQRLTDDNRAAMRWVQQEAPPDARFAVLSDSGAWQGDEVGEWFPALTGRVSVNTVQGSEWLPGEFTRSMRRYGDLAACQFEDPTAECLLEWDEQWDAEITHVYLAGRPDDVARVPCCDAFVESLAASPEFRLIYEQGEVAIFERTGAGSAVDP